MISKWISIILCNCCFTVSMFCSGNIDSTELFNRLFEKPAYKSWVTYWSHSFVDVDFNNLHLNIIRNDTILFSKLDIDKYFSKRLVRNFTLNYSPNKDYVFDSYDDKEFRIENDSLKYFGGDVDPSISILCLHDSLYCYHTNGPSSFYDESVWLSDNICVALGFSWSASNIEEESGLFITLTLYDLQKKKKIIYLSQRFPFSQNQFRLNSFSYLKHKFPNIFIKVF